MKVIFLFLISTSIFSESFLYPSISPEQILEDTIWRERFSQGNCHQASQSILINSLDHSDRACQLYLGWGHTRSSHHMIQEFAGTGIGMGCNAGESHLGEMKKDYVRFQRGSNGTYRNHQFQGTQNGGLNPIILPENAPKLLHNHNSYLGFMRLTQYHWLQLFNFSHDYLFKNRCRSVAIKFVCSDQRDLNDRELSKRLSAYKKKNFDLLTKSDPYSNELEILKRFEPLKNCFENDMESLPPKCDHEVIIDKNIQIKSHCQEWVKTIQQMEQHNWETPSSLPAPKRYDYPSRGILN